MHFTSYWFHHINFNAGLLTLDSGIHIDMCIITVNSLWSNHMIRACLDQLLIAIRSLLIVCNHVRSKKKTDRDHQAYS